MCMGCYDLAGDIVASQHIAAPIWQKIPSDLSWGEDLDPDLGNDKPLTRRQRAPHDEPTGKWYHVSTQPLTPGTKIVPRGGESPDSSFYDDEGTGYDNTNRQNHVWLAPSLARAYSWSANLNAPHIHEVKPGDKPQPWNFSGTNGWVAPHAHVTRQVPREEAKAAEDEFYEKNRYVPGGTWETTANLDYHEPGFYGPPPKSKVMTPEQAHEHVKSLGLDRYDYHDWNADYIADAVNRHVDDHHNDIAEGGPGSSGLDYGTFLDSVSESNMRPWDSNGDIYGHPKYDEWSQRPPVWTPS